MIMDVKRRLSSLGHVVFFCLGFLLMCGGTYLLSLQTELGYTWMGTMSYIMMVFGLLAVVVALFWTICHSIKSKLYQRGGCQQHIQVFTIERLNSLPPSYEESQGSRAGDAAESVVVVDGDGGNVVTNLAPPLYHQDSSEAADCTWSWEQPPPYSQAVGIQQGEVDAEALCRN